jgi:hypothetical protein
VLEYWRGGEVLVLKLGSCHGNRFAVLKQRADFAKLAEWSGELLLQAAHRDTSNPLRIIRDLQLASGPSEEEGCSYSTSDSNEEKPAAFLTFIFPFLYEKEIKYCSTTWEETRHEKCPQLWARVLFTLLICSDLLFS